MKMQVVHSKIKINQRLSKIKILKNRVNKRYHLCKIKLKQYLEVHLNKNSQKETKQNNKKEEKIERYIRMKNKK